MSAAVFPRPCSEGMWRRRCRIVSRCLLDAARRMMLSCLTFHIRRSLDLPHEQKRLRDRGNVAHEQHAQAPRQQRGQRDQLEVGRRPGSLPGREFSGQGNASFPGRGAPHPTGRNAPLHRGGIPEKVPAICPPTQVKMRAADWRDGQIKRRIRASRCREELNA